MEFNATFIAAFVSFVLFTVVMNLILYKPINKIVSQRQEFLDESHSAAQKAKEQAQIVLSNKEEKIEQAKHDGKRIIADTTEKSKIEKASLTSQTQNEAMSKIDEAKSELKTATEEVKGELSNKVIDLAQDISTKILGENIPIKEPDTQIISKIMQES